MNCPVATMKMEAVGTSEIPVVTSVSMWCISQYTALYHAFYFVSLIKATAAVFGKKNFKKSELRLRRR
jgi:hypothetical protein